MDDILKEAIADAKALRATALENAKIALEEAFTPRLKSMLSQKIQSEDEEYGEGEGEVGSGDGQMEDEDDLEERMKDEDEEEVKEAEHMEDEGEHMEDEGEHMEDEEMEDDSKVS